MYKPAAPCPKRLGATLIEVVVVLTVSGLLVLSARAVFDGMALGAKRVDAVTASADETANRQQLLRDLVYSAEVADGPYTFQGNSAGLALSTWCLVGGGWLEECRAAISIRRDVQGAVVVIQTDRGDSLVALRADAGARFLYLRSDTTAVSWANKWDDARTLPRAIGIARARDTLVLRTGAR